MARGTRSTPLACCWSGGEQEQGQAWLQQAAAQGHERAQAELGKLPAAGQPRPVVAPGGNLAEQWQQAALGCDSQALARLLDSGAAVDTLDDFHRNALYYLVACDSQPGMRLLLDHGIDVNIADRFGESPLMLAVKQANRAAVQLLLAKGADMTATTASGDTLLHLAVAGHATQVLATLLNGRGPNSVENKAGHTPLDMAFLLQDEAAQQLLAGAGARHGSHWQAQTGDVGSSIAGYLAQQGGIDGEAGLVAGEAGRAAGPARGAGGCTCATGVRFRAGTGRAGPDPADLCGRVLQYRGYARTGGGGRATRPAKQRWQNRADGGGGQG